MPNDSRDLKQYNTAATLAAAIATALGAAPAEEQGDGWLTFCPVHEADGEHSPSLMVFETNLHCHCRTGGDACKGRMAGALRALGILVRPPQSTDYPWTEERRHAWVSGCGEYELEHIKEVAHCAQAARGNYRAVAVGDKRFRWAARPAGSLARMTSTRRWEGTDQSLFELHPQARPTLYKAAELGLEGGIACLLLVEGEKDADAALSLGVPATCTYQGAGQRLTEAQLELLLKVELLVVCGDHDDAGAHYVRHVAAAVRARGKECYHLALDYEGEKDDLSDWLGRQDDPGAALLAALDRCLPAPEGGDDDGVATAWTEGLRRNRNGTLLTDSDNWRLILSNDRHIATRLRFNVRLRQPEYFDEREQKWRTNVDGVALVVKTAFDLYGRGSTAPGKGTCAQLVQAHRPHHDEYSDRLAELPQWDGLERVKHLFGKYLGCGGASEAYLELVSITHFTGQMARILEPGAKHDYMPILLGPQGFFKSTALRELCLIPSAFMEVPIPDRIDKAFTRNLVGNELVEIPEGQTLFSNKARTDTVKGWTSIRVDTLDMKYLSADAYPRTWVPIITANEDAGKLLTGLSGHRKFPIMHVTRHADIAAIREDFEQLWAESLHLVLHGIRDHLDYYGMEQMGDEIARSHVQFDEALMEEIERYLTHNWDRMVGGGETEWTPRETPRDRVFARDIYPALFGMDGIHVPRPRQIEMHRILRHLGYRKWKGKARQQDAEDSPGKITNGATYRGWESWDRTFYGGSVTPSISFSEGSVTPSISFSGGSVTPSISAAGPFTGGHLESALIHSVTLPPEGGESTGKQSDDSGKTGVLGGQVDRLGHIGVYLSNTPGSKANPKVDTTFTVKSLEEKNDRENIREESSTGVVSTCASPAELQSLLSQHPVASVLGLDVETDSAGRLRLVQVSDGSTTVVVDVREHPDVPRLLGGRRFAAHNAAFEAGKLAGVGVYPELDCTLIAHRVLTAEVKDDDKAARKHDLATCVLEEGGPKLDKQYQAAENWDGDLTEAHVDYAAQDAVWAFKLWALYEERLRADGMLGGYRLIASCVRPAADMHRIGFHLDRDGHARLIAKYRSAALEALKDYAQVPWTRLCMHPKPSKTVCKAWPELGDDWLQLVAGLQSGKIMTEGLLQVLPKDVRLNWRRGGAKKDQLVLDRRYVKRQLKRLRDPSANPQVREQMVEIADLLEHRAKFIKCTKLLSAFGETLVEMADADGRLHGEFVLAKAATGRTSCKSPNLQQLPNANDFRNLFTAPYGRVLVVGDYTQIEVRVAGLLAGEPKIAQFFRSGYDVHKASAALMYRVPYEKVSKSQRKAAKAITFGILYGMGADALAEQLGCDKGGAEEQLRIWEQAFPVLSAWREQEAKDAKARGYVLMADGRRVRCTANSRPAQLYNYPVQGTAASCQYAALAWLWEAFQVFGVDATVVAVVHDEMVVECAEGEVGQATELLREAMAHGMRAVFGADVELAHLCGIAAGADWSEKE